MEDATTGPRAELFDERECDFAETLAALHALLGRLVTVLVLGGVRHGRSAPLALRGRLRRGYELHDDDEGPVCFELDGVLLLVSPDTVAGAWRDEYRRCADGRHWVVVTLQYAGGARLEIEELI